MDEKLNSTIDRIVQLTKQNAEFDEELRKRLGCSSANLDIIGDGKINQIYEYCIKKILKDQAKDFYKDFPIKDIIPSLEHDFIRMEGFKRSGNFGDFSLAMYQQIECITNKICESKILAEVVEKMLGYPAYVKVETGKEINIKERLDSTYTIASLLFPGTSKKTGMPNSYEKSKISLQAQTAKDKIRIIVYFFGFNAKMKNSDFDNFVEITNTLADIYSCRNMNHRGNTPNDFEQQTVNRIRKMESHYYYKFMGALAQFVDFITTGTPQINEIKEYAQTLTSRKIKNPGPKILGKVDLKDDGKKRF